MLNKTDIFEMNSTLSNFYPQLADEYSKDLNDKKFDDFTAGSNTKVNWVCPRCQNIWIGSIFSRTKRGTGCPDCKYVNDGNSLLEKFPDLAKEYNNELNDKNSFMIPAKSGKKVWWKCVRGHEWKATVASRTSYNSGCLKCKLTSYTKDSNRLSDLKPELSKEWAENNVFKPEDLSINSSYEATWVCSNNHVWKQSVKSRVNKNSVCPECHQRTLDKTVADFVHLSNEWGKNLLSPDEVSYGSAYKAQWVCENNHTWNAKVYSRTRNSGVGTGCPECSAKSFSSKSEKEIQLFLKEKGVNLETNVRNVIENELDIYIPEKSIAIEFNGLFWHSNMNGKTKDYHKIKYDLCKDKNIQLIQIWEDDWSSKKEIVKKSLLHKIGVPNGKPVGARLLTVEKISYEESSKFLENNHIQSSATGSEYFGLKKNGELFAVMVIKNHKDKKEIVRYATSVNIPGGFTKILKHVEKTENFKQWFTFSDNCISDGGLYKNNGFIIDKELKPDYMYIINKKRVHKFNYRKQAFKNNPNLKYEEGLTESQLAELNKIPKIWDAGKTRWIKNINNS